MRLWCISREYSGLAESGGVKNVTYALCKGMLKRGHKVVLFIPMYGSVKLDRVKGFERDYVAPVKIKLEGRGDKIQEVHIDKGHIDGIKVLFIRHPSFSEKLGVYTWTKEEEALDPNHKKGEGHPDVKFLDVLFQKAIAAYWARGVPPWSTPDIIHCHDATTALVPSFIGALSSRISLFAFSAPKFIVTIHNAGPGYHHEFWNIDDAAYWTGLPRPLLENSSCGSAIEPFLIAANSGAYITTVSPKYARELLDPQNADVTGGLSTQFYQRGIKIEGIANGIDFTSYDTRDTNISLLPYSYDPMEKDLKGKWDCRAAFLKGLDDNTPYLGLTRYGANTTIGWEDKIWFCFHGRMVRQKGVFRMCAAIRAFLKDRKDAVFVIMGQGETVVEDECKKLSHDMGDNVVYFSGYDKAFSRLCIASSNFLLLPSVFEPCGLEDLIGNILGTVPIANMTGGLAKIIDGKTGFLYSPNTPEVLRAKLDEVSDIYERNRHAFDDIVQCAAYSARYNFSWDMIIGEHYEPLMRHLKKL